MRLDLCGEEALCVVHQITKLQIPRSWLDPQPVTDPCCDPASDDISPHMMYGVLLLEGSLPGT